MNWQESRDAIEKYINENYIGDNAAPDMQSGIRDAITDLLHLCDKHELDFNQRVEYAKDSYDEEVASEVEKTGHTD